MELERDTLSSSFASVPRGAVEDASAADRMDMEAAEILAALAHSKKRFAVTFSQEFGAQWGCKGRRVRKRTGTSSESPPSGVGSSPVQSGSDLAEDQAAVGQEQSQVTSTSGLIEPVEAESSHPCTEIYTSNGVVRSRQNVTEAEQETCRLHRMLTNMEFDWHMIRERPILFSSVGMPEKDIWEDSQLDEVAGNDAHIKQVKTEQIAESVKSSPTSATKHMSCGVGRSRQNLTEEEKEARRLRRILANRESARQTIRRRQALCEKLTRKVADLTQENENLKRAKELALKEYQSQDSTNKRLKAEMAKAMQAEEWKTTAEHKLDHQNSGPSRNYPYIFYNQHPFPPFCWPSIVQSQCGNQNAVFVPSNISSPANGNGRLDSSFNQENSIDVNGPKTALYVVPYPWFFSRPDHRSGSHPQPSCGPKDMKDEPSVSNLINAECSLKPVVNKEKYNSCLAVEVEKEGPNNLNCTSARLPVDEGGRCMFHIKEEVLVPTPLCSAGTSFITEPENKADHVVKTEEAPIGPFHFADALPEDNQESTYHMSKKVLDALAATEARKRRKELTKLKNLHSRQRTPLSLSAKI